MRQQPNSPFGSSPHLKWILAVLLSICAVILLIPLRRSLEPAKPVARPSDSDSKPESAFLTVEPTRHATTRGSATLGSDTPEEIVANKLAQFGRIRRGFAHALAQRHGVVLPDDVDQFFDAVESGNWDDIEAAFKKINGGDSSAGHSQTRSPDLTYVWPAIIDAYGAAEQAHLWPAQQLLDYGNAILDSLRPGMVYVGGTDSGRWIPSLLNDTSAGDQHVVITQNGLADATYLDYLRLQYDERIATLTEEDSQRAFKEYLADIEKRYRHDRENPDAAKQLRPGENIKIADGRTQVSGQMAVMAINEKLLDTLLVKNPDLSFAIQESIPLKGTYADALPLGPLMELRARTDVNGFTPERAAQSVSYWNDAAQTVLADAGASGSESTLKSYSHDATAAANLLAAHDFTSEAEQTYRVSARLWPGNPEAICGLAEVYARTGREADALRIIEDFSARYPDQSEALERVSPWLWIRRQNRPGSR